MGSCKRRAGDIGVARLVSGPDLVKEAWALPNIRNGRQMLCLAYAQLAEQVAVRSRVGVLGTRGS